MMPEHQPPTQQPGGSTTAVIVQPNQRSGGGMIVLIVVGILVIAVVGTVILSGVLYVWANSLAADQVETGSRNVYNAEDASASVGSGSYDDLMTIRWSHAEEGYNWAFVTLKITVGDNTYDCSPNSGDECFISQSGWDDQMWETSETLTLSENGVNICSSSCYIDIYVTYRGSAVAGTDSLYVS